MKLLCIGNSFSQDATRYLHGIARAGGVPLTVVNLYIGGCPLDRHYRNMLSGERAYGFELNGADSGLKVSLDEALYSDRFDAITLQQLSSTAPRFETYEPYLSALAAHVRQAQPAAKLYMHETWAYERNSHRLTEELGYPNEEQMTADLVKAYAQACAAIGADVVPAARAFAAARQMGAEKLHRDTYHASWNLGRYILALTMYAAVTGNSPVGNTFRDFDAPIDEQLIALAQQAAAKAVSER